jgi:CheY-like chemotaxis protein
MFFQQPDGRPCRFWTEKFAEVDEVKGRGSFARRIGDPARLAHALQSPQLTMSNPADARHIVLVDDEEALAWSLSSRLQKVRPNDKVVTANDGVSAITAMREHAPDLLIADIRMPGMSGIDLILHARSTWPELPVVVMTAFKSAEIQRLTPGPFTGFLEKPFEFERLLELVDEALAPPKVGFSGAVLVQTLPDIVQLYVLSAATGVLSIKHGPDEGHLWFAQGVIRHAATKSARGDEAFFEIMMWSGGDFCMRPYTGAAERSVNSDWQELLLESCRRIDEHHRMESRISRPGWTQKPPPPPMSTDDLLDAAFDGFETSPESTPRIPSPVSSTSTSSSVRRTDHNTTINEESSEAPTMNIKDSLSKLNAIDGFVGAAVVDSESGMLLGSEGGGGLNLEVAAAGNTEVVKAKRKTMANLGLKESIEDILITLGKQYHLIRPLRTRPTIFFYVALDRQRANLAMARITLSDVEKDLQV